MDKNLELGAAEQGVKPRTIRSVCVYCSSSNRAAPHWMELAFAVGKMLAQAGIRLVYGGGAHGLMGQVARGAGEAGGEVLGIVPTFLMDRESVSAHLTTCIETKTMHERKQEMVNEADGFIVLPGGLGTLDELFEVLTWKQLGLITLPVVILNDRNYWSTLLRLLDEMVDHKLCSPQDLENLAVASRLEQVLPLMRQQSRKRMDASWKFA